MEGPTDISWFDDHYYSVPRQIVDFLAGDNISLEGRKVADIGTGDGIIALGLHQLAQPAELVAYDVDRTDENQLLALARQYGVAVALPEGLQFVKSSKDRIPAPDGAFDFVVSWSAFEHVADLSGMCREVDRVLAPGGVLMIQLYPFYFSEHGDHGWHRAGFSHLVSGVDEPADDAYLNRITLDDLHRALLASGLHTRKVELIHHAFHVPPELLELPLSVLAIAGVKLLVTKAMA